MPQPSDLFCLQTDASGVAIGTVLSVFRDGEEHPVAFYSRKLSQLSMPTVHELEGLTVVFSAGRDYYCVI